MSSAEGQHTQPGNELFDAFLSSYGTVYGYNNAIESWRNKEFGRLKGTYLDHVGATLYSKSQIRNYMEDLELNVFGNPHSGNLCSQLSSTLVYQARQEIAAHFNTSLDKHHVIFTSGATAALRLIAESFQWSCLSSFVFLDDNHTSAVGIKELVKSAGGESICVTENAVASAIEKKKIAALNSLSNLKPSHYLSDEIPFREDSSSESRYVETCHLFCFPAMSNFCGRKYCLEWVDDIHDGCLSSSFGSQGKWFVVLDAASYVGTSCLDLSSVAADFVVVSFYKLFGFPTGIGALIVRSDAAYALRSKVYYGGGTLSSTIPSIDHHVFKTDIAERHEDGTLAFHSIIALKYGFQAMRNLTGSMQAVSEHTFALAKYTYEEMATMKHGNGQSLCVIYSDTKYDDIKHQGPIINFNLIDNSGCAIGYTQVENVANMLNISLRSGCFCNAGDCQKHLQLSAEDMLSNYEAGHVCGDSMDIIDGQPTGSIRISFGYMSTYTDARTFLDFIRNCFTEYDNIRTRSFRMSHELIQERPAGQTETTLLKNWDSDNESSQYPIPFLKKIYIYPIKSCGSFSASEWVICETGLLYDREWMIVTECGMVLTQKKDARMSLIKPFIDLKQKTLTLSCKGYVDLSVSLDRLANADLKEFSNFDIESKVCGTRVYCSDCGEDAATWLSTVLGKSCRLLRQNLCQPRFLKRHTVESSTITGVRSRLALANESQYLLISESSLSELTLGLDDSIDKNSVAPSFRANFLIQGFSPFKEESWKEVVIGKCNFKVVGNCKRCNVITINQSTAEKNKKPLEALMKVKGRKMEFGIYLVLSLMSTHEMSISVGQLVVPK